MIASTSEQDEPRLRADLAACLERQTATLRQLQNTRILLRDPRHAFDATLEIGRLLATFAVDDSHDLPHLIRACRAAHLDSDPRISSLLADARGTLNELLECVTELTEAVRQQRDLLEPQLDGALRESRANEAYSRVAANRFQ